MALLSRIRPAVQSPSLLSPIRIDASPFGNVAPSDLAPYCGQRVFGTRRFLTSSLTDAWNEVEARSSTSGGIIPMCHIECPQVLLCS
ncbi:hypothetical protein ACLKA7_006748 [Drosophila subpalustris]